MLIGGYFCAGTCAVLLLLLPSPERARQRAGRLTSPLSSPPRQEWAPYPERPAPPAPLPRLEKKRRTTTSVRQPGSRQWGNSPDPLAETGISFSLPSFIVRFFPGCAASLANALLARFTL